MLALVGDVLRELGQEVQGSEYLEIAARAAAEKRRQAACRRL